MRPAVAGELVGNVPCATCAMFRTRMGRDKTNRRSLVLYCKNAAGSQGCGGFTTITDVVPTTTPAQENTTGDGLTATEKVEQGMPRSLVVLAWAMFAVMLHMGLVRVDQAAAFQAVDTEASARGTRCSSFVRI